MQNGLVVDHAEAVTISNAKFVVRPAGRAKVLAEKRKNVHAFVVGELTRLGYANEPLAERISYNPYKAGHFIKAVTGDKVDKASLVMLKSDRSVWALDPCASV